MKVSVLLFASARERLGRDRLQVELPAPATVDDLRQQLQRDWPLLSDLWPHCHVAVNEDYAGRHVSISEEDTIACIPPVSGG
jgi:molybdopterin converting factor subunit 1